jgi:hypothetical protein
MHDGGTYDLLKERHSPDGPNGVSRILALGLQESLENPQAVIEELGQEVSLDTMRRRFAPEMKSLR